MKNKIFIPILIMALFLPQVASAAWWNPFSWKVFGKVFSPKVEVFEDNKAIDQESNNNVPTTTEESEIDKLRAEIEDLKKSKEEEKSEPKPSTTSQPAVSKPTPTPLPIQTPTNTVVTYDAVVKKYTDFQSIITSERSGLKKNSSLPTEMVYFNFLDEILNKTNSDLGYLESIRYWNPRPVGIEATYLTKFDSLKSDYDMRARGYRVDFEEERIISAQQNMEAWKQQETQAVQDEINAEELAKQEKLKEVNKKIADLNAKYAADMKECGGGGKTTSGVTACKNYITTTYTDNYNTLMAEWQQIYYSD